MRVSRIRRAVHTRWQRRMPGVTHRLMREAHCPVMILPRGTEQQLERLVERQTATTT